MAVAKARGMLTDSGRAAVRGFFADLRGPGVDEVIETAGAAGIRSQFYFATLQACNPNGPRMERRMRVQSASEFPSSRARRAG
jgi:hypothetical protein